MVSPLRAFSASPRMSPSEAPQSDEPYCSTACFSSAIWRALTEKLGFFERSKPITIASSFWPDLEAVRTLLVAVAAEVGALDEAGRTVVAGLHFEPAVAHFEHGHGDHVVLLQAAAARPGAVRRRRRGRALLELLHAQADALLLDIDVEHDRLHFLALAVQRQRVLARDAPGDVGHVDHAVDVAGEADEQAELGGVLDFALDVAPIGCFSAKASHGLAVPA